MMTGFSTPRTAIKDSFDDEDPSDDADDEVFIRDGRSGFKANEEFGVKRPLMAPRRKYKSHSDMMMGRRPFYKRCWSPYCYGLIALTVIFGSLVGAVLFVNLLPASVFKLGVWSSMSQAFRGKQLNIVPCTEISSQKIWTQSYPKLKSEAALVAVDLNSDEVEDIVVGYATGIDETSMPGDCSQFSDAKNVCGGGAMALDGKTGEIIWRYWTRKDVLFVDCSANVNADVTNDCLLTGKGGVLCIVDGRNGNLIWELSKSKVPNLLDVYSAQFIFDLDGDNYADVLLAHTSDQSGHLLILNGREGQMMGQIVAPGKEGIFTAPRVKVTKDGTYVVVFATGSFDSAGSLYTIPLHELATANGVSNPIKVWNGDLGVSSGILLVDLNGDDLEDVILTAGSTLTVLDGSNYSVLWNASSVNNEPLSEPKQILTGPTPGYFNVDSTPDLLVTHMVGPSFPAYYYSQTWVADGKSGKKLLDEPLLGSDQMTAPGITVSYTGAGNDMFLFWMTTCNVPPEQQRQPYKFAKETTLHERAHADTCMLRFNKSLELQLVALNEHIEPPGALIYSSNTEWNLEHANISVSEYKPVIRPPVWAEGGVEELSNKFPAYSSQEDKNTAAQLRDPSNMLLPIGINLGESAIDYDSGASYPSPDGNEGGSAMGEEGRDERAGANIKRRKRRRTKRSRRRQGVAVKSTSDFSWARSLSRASATTTLAKALQNSGIDAVFAAHWETPASNVRILTEKEEQCIRNRILTARQTSNLNELELEVTEEAAKRDCLPQYLDEPSDSGQLTVYRVNIQCTCSEIDTAIETCSTPLPMQSQSFSHRATDVYFRTRRFNQ